MSKVFRIETFNYNFSLFMSDFTLTGQSVIDSPGYNNPIIFDYLTLESFDVYTTEKMDTKELDFVIIYENSTPFYYGIVSEVTIKKALTTISIKPLLSFFDVTCPIMINRFTADFPLERAICSNLTFITADILGNILNCFSFYDTTSTYDTTIEFENPAMNFWELCLNVFNQYNIFVNASLDMANKKFIVTVGKKEETPKNIECGLKNIIDYTINIGNKQNDIDLLIVTHDGWESECINITDNQPPYKITTIYQDYLTDETADEWKARAVLAAEEYKAKSKYQDQIEITISNNCFTDYAVGDLVNVIENGVSYSTILTGIEYMGEIKKFIFGSVRTDLTKILALERRSKK